MKDQLQHLNNQLDSIPSANFCRGFSELNRILENYTKILDSANSFNDDYKRATIVYYPDINVIRDNIQESLYAETQQKKCAAFDKARTELKKDIQALTILMMTETELAE